MSLIDYAKTERQREAIKAWQDCGEVVAKAAGVLGVSPSTLRDHIGAVKNAAAAAGYSENFDARRLVPEGEVVIGRSIYTTTDDNEKIWLKTKRTMTEAERDKSLQGFVDGLTKGLPQYKPKAKPKNKKFDPEDLLPSYRHGRCPFRHAGRRSRNKEKGLRYEDSGSCRLCLPL